MANICDAGYIGIRKTISNLAMLLRPLEINPHATLLTLFLNAIVEILGSRSEANRMPKLDTLMAYLPRPEIQSCLSPHSADMMRLWDARSLVIDVRELFNE